MSARARAWTWTVGAAAAGWAAASAWPTAAAEPSEAGQEAARKEAQVGAFAAGSGMPVPGLMKDTCVVTRIPDPAVDGVTLYITQMKRPLADRWREPFTDPSEASLSVVRTKRDVKFTQPIDLTPSGEHVASLSKNLFFKRTMIRRIWDAETKTLVYVAHSERLTTNMESTNSRFRTSTAAVALAL